MYGTSLSVSLGRSEIDDDVWSIIDDVLEGEINTRLRTYVV